MRAQILRVAMAAVILAVVVLGIPLAFAVSRIVTDDERSELEQLALRAAVAVSPDYASGDPIELPRTERGVRLGVYDPGSQRVAGTGPRRLEGRVQAALSGRAVNAEVRGQLLEALPVSVRERVIGVVRASSPTSLVRYHTVLWWAALAGVSLAAAALAGLFAAHQSRRLAAPLGSLARTAADLGGGDFSARSSPAGVAEIDAVGDSLNRTAHRLASMLDRERSFMSQASHQLKTPLTQLQLELEAGLERGGNALAGAATSAMSITDQLSRTIDDVLALAKQDTAAASFDAEELLEQCRRHWEGPLARAGRPMRLIVEQQTRVSASLPAIRQILHVLLDNAFRHGQGTVTLRLRPSLGVAAVDVIDEGTAPPISLAHGAGMGLELANSLAASQGGRLMVDQQGQGTRFTLLLPVPSERAP
jgi:signal transduction histidine kinase